MQQEPWVSLEAVAMHVGVSEDTVHRWIRAKNMPAHKVGRLWKFQLSEVNEWVRAGKAVEPAEDASGCLSPKSATL